MTDLSFDPTEPIAIPTALPSEPLVDLMCAVQSGLAAKWVELLTADPIALQSAIADQRDGDALLGDAVDALAGGGVLPAMHIEALNAAPQAMKVEVLDAAARAAEDGMGLHVAIHDRGRSSDMGASVVTWYQLEDAPVAWRVITVQVPRPG
jgi:hypothetical protein